jgi:glycine cleavage system H protein
MEFPEDLYYTETHEWLRVKNGEAEVGLTSYAQEQLKDIVFVELPRIGKKIQARQPCGAVESVKAAYDIYAPVSGEVINVNKDMESQPELVNKDPYGKGWMFRLKIEDKGHLKSLLNAQAYASKIKEAH